MAKHKKLRTAYTSKGQRRNVARKTVNAMRRDRRLKPSIDSIFQKIDYKRMILGRSKDRSIADLRKKYVEQEQIRLRADSLHKQFQSAGVTWAACVQAVKTDWITQLEMRFGRMNVKTKEKGKALGK